MVLYRTQTKPVKLNFNAASGNELVKWLNYLVAHGSKVEWTDYLRRTVREENGLFLMKHQVANHRSRK